MRKAIGFYVLRLGRQPPPRLDHAAPDAGPLAAIGIRGDAADFADARERLTREPISTPAIFSLAGIKAE